MIPLLSEIARFLRYLFTPESPVSAVHYGGATAGAAKAGMWIVLAVVAGLAVARLLGGAA